MSPRSAAAFPNSRSAPEADRTAGHRQAEQSQQLLAGGALEGAEWEGYTVKEYGDPDAFGHRKKMSVAEDLSNEIKAATGEETIVSDLTYDLRSGSPDFVDRMVAATFAGMAMDAIAGGQARPDDRHQQRLLRHGRDSRSQARTAPRGRGIHVQHGALPPDVTTTSWGFRSSSRGRNRLDWKRFFSKGTPAKARGSHRSCAPASRPPSTKHRRTRSTFPPPSIPASITSS